MKKTCLLLWSILIFLSANSLAQNFPANFSQVKIGPVYYPTAMAFAPDGRLFVCEKAGRVKVIKNGTVLSTPFLSVSVSQEGERGLTGIAFDPNFASNKYVYVFYTTSSTPIHNRLSRFTANGDVAVAGSETVLIDFEPVLNNIHNGGGMEFGPDGKLYLALGDDRVSSNAQNLENHKGKVLRLNRDGSPAAGNPFTGSLPKQRIWAYGLRNPYTLSIQPGTGKIYVNDVGEGGWEEINDATVAGRNFGWPSAEGNSSNTAYTNPVYTYPHGDGNLKGCAISGGTWFNPGSTNWPSQYIGKYFFIDYCNGWINYLSGSTPTTFASNLNNSSWLYVKAGPDGNLYYASISASGIYKIIYNGTSTTAPPSITSQPQSVTVFAGQSASFSVSASGTSPLSYQWKKNGVSISGATSSTYTINSTVLADSGSYSCTVTNSYGSTTSNAAKLTVLPPNNPPVASITSPASGTFYSAGDTIFFSGSGTDPEDGTLPGSAFSWTVVFHHSEHTHPGPFISPGSKTGWFYIPYTGEPSADVYYRLILTVKDSKGREDTAAVKIYPRTSVVTLASDPPGLQINLDGQPKTSPFSFTGVEEMERNFNAFSPQVLNGKTYVFDKWSNGGAASQNVRTPINDSTFTAYFKVDSSICTASGTIRREMWSNVQGTLISDIPVSSPPTSVTFLTSFEGPRDIADNYGARFRGYICAPATGNYTFYISSNNTSELWLSNSSDPAGKVKIASVPDWTHFREVTKYPSQKSVLISLVAGQQYYVEALHKEAALGDHISVGWTLPNGTTQMPIPGSRLSPFSPSGNNPPVVSITAPSNGATYTAPASITINASASDDDGTVTNVQFYSGTTLLGSDNTAPYSFAWNNVPAGSYSLIARATDNSGNSSTSAIVNITVTSSSSGGDTLIHAGAAWKYLDNGSAPPSEWKTIVYNDGGWKTGNAQFGYGDGDENTLVNYGPDPENKYITTYFRKVINVPDPSLYPTLNLNLLRDDGAIVYINGNEVYRNNMPSGWVSHTTLASTGVDGTNESTFISATISPTYLVPGSNLIAVEIHQSYPASSDLSFDMRLVKGSGQTTACATPKSLSTSSITSSSARINWESITAATSYNIQYRKVGVTGWVRTNVTSNYANLSGLLPSTSYEWQVQPVCSSGTGTHSMKASFTTSGSNAEGVLIEANSQWKYLDNGSNQGTAWRSASFDDATWKSGNAEFGYGDGDEATVVSYGPSTSSKYITTYFRKKFNVTDKSLFPSLDLSMVRDDGIVIYINGTEVYRNNMPTGTVYYNTVATIGLDGVDEAAFHTATINGSVLVNGTNTIAVEIHQSFGGSSDISFNLRLQKSNAALARYPTVQTIDETSVKISWETTQESSSFVHFGERAIITTKGEGTLTRVHEVELRDLKPGTRYYFVVGEDERVYAPDSTWYFTTSGEVADRVAELADPGLLVFPNPFTNETTISYKLSEAEATQLEISDMVGRIVYKVEGDGSVQPEGEHRYTFNPEELGLRDGIYIVRLLVKEKAFTQKISYVK